MTDVFGKVHLGYLVIETEKFDDWRRFGRDAIGMHLDETLPAPFEWDLKRLAASIVIAAQHLRKKTKTLAVLPMFHAFGMTLYLLMHGIIGLRIWAW